MKLLIIIPFYNVKNHLQQSIEGILQQTHKNVELCLVDDCSTDGSLEIAEYYKDYPNITLLKNKENRGAYYSVNKALYYFKDKEWEYFHFHGADDVSDLTRVEKILNYLESNPNMLGCKSTYVRVHYDTQEIDIENGRQHITTSEGISFISRKAFENLGYYDNTRFSGDTDYWWRLEQFCFQNNYTVGEHTEPLYIAYLRGEDNLTVKNPIKNRGGYYNKIQNEIKEMVNSRNFYREKFD
jgi:glycosyltransferase involved in cell wall biosynthesis